MKKLNRKQMVAVAIMIFCAATAVVGGAVYADETNGKNNPMSGLVTAIAQKFNLSEADVQAVVDAQRLKMEAEREANRAEMEAKRQTEMETKLSELVSSGKLTQTQADAIKAKRAELRAQTEVQRQNRQTEMETMKNMTEEQRRAAMEKRKTEMETKRAALKQWASDNGIPEEYLNWCGMGAGGPGMGHGRGGGFGGLKSE